MKSTLLVLLGMLGFAVVGGGATVYFFDGGLARAMYEADAALQSLDADEKREVLDLWAAQVRSVANAGANGASAPTSPRKDSPSPSSPSPYGEQPGVRNNETGNEQPTASGALDELSGAHERLLANFAAARQAWEENRDKVDGVKAALRDARDYLKHANEAFRGLSEEERQIFMEQADSVKREVLSHFQNSFATFGRLRLMNEEVQKLYDACLAEWDKLRDRSDR